MGLVDYSQKKALNTSLKEKTALNLFDKFLLFVNDTSMAKLKKKDVTLELLGKFGSYMFQNCASLKKSSPALAYMSHVKSKLIEVFKTDVFDKNPKGYQRLRNKMQEDFDDRQLKKGNSTVKKADGVGEEALLFASEILFDNTTGDFGSVEKRFGNRLLLLLSRALVGRISEVRELKFEQFKYCSKAQCAVVSDFVDGICKAVNGNFRFIGLIGRRIVEAVMFTYFRMQSIGNYALYMLWRLFWC
jgi:hypothetical protein